MKKSLVTLCLAFSLLGCAARSTRPIHPGSLNQFESDAYDVMYGTKVLIDAAREQLINGTLTVKATPVFNNLTAAYTLAKDALKAYDDAARKGSAAVQQKELQNDLTALSTAINAFKGVKP